MEKKIKVTVWHEFRQEKSDKSVRKVYPEGMHTVRKNLLNDGLGQAD